MAPQLGEQAPDFALKNQHGQTVRLSQFRGQSAVVVVFYPWAFSRVCGGELHELQKHLDEFQNDEVALLTISCDAMYTLRAFADREGFTFPMLQDFWPHGEVASAYGVFERGRRRRPARHVRHRQGGRGALDGDQPDPRRP